MTTTLVNSTLPCITEQIETVLDQYPYHPYQQAFAIPDLRQRLIAFVLNQVPSLYAVQNQAEEWSTERVSWERIAKIDSLIHEGIDWILSENLPHVSHHIPHANPAGLEPSHWFG